MGTSRLEKLIKIRNKLEDIQAKITRMINREELANAIVKLTNNERVMYLLESQNLQDNVERGA